jgi:hypothetical protein
VKLIPSLKGAASSDLRSVEVLGRGGGLHCESLDLDLSVPALVLSVFANLGQKQTSHEIKKRDRLATVSLKSISTDYSLVAVAFQCALTPAFRLFERRLRPCG